MFLGNAALVWRLFLLEYTRHTGSIEAAFISISEQWLRHGFTSWWPLWYGGIPFENTYPPLLHATVALVAKLSTLSAPWAYHVVTAVVYSAGPVTLYALVRGLGGDRRRAMLAGLLYSVLSLSTVLVRLVRDDAGGWFAPRRLQALVVYGEGPHLGAMLLLPLAVLALHKAIEDRRWLPAAVLALASVALTNWLGAFALAAAAWCYLAARGERPAWARAAAAAVLAYLLASPMLPPSNLTAIRTNAQRVGGEFPFGLANAALLAAVLLAALALARWLRRASLLLRFSAAFGLVMTAIPLAAEWGKVAILPQPQRYHLEMEMALCLLLAAAAPARRWVAVAAAFLCIYPAAIHWRQARQWLEPISMQRTSEYRVARWLEANLPAQRVMVPGSISFWLNSFTDQPQFAGGFEQAILSPAHPGAHFQILSGMGAGAEEGRVAAAWLRIFGVQAVAVSGSGSTETFHPFANPLKFDGVLPELWRDGGDVVYAVPQRAPLARVLRREELPAKPVAYFHQTSEVAAYLAAIEDPSRPFATARWLSRSRLSIELPALASGDVLSLAISAHPGWRAERDGRAIATQRDALGHLWLDPGPGAGPVDLVFDGGAERQWTLALCLLSLAATAFLSRTPWRRAR